MVLDLFAAHPDSQFTTAELFRAGDIFGLSATALRTGDTETCGKYFETRGKEEKRRILISFPSITAQFTSPQIVVGECVEPRHS